MKLNCLIIEDEPAGRKILEEYIRLTGFLDLAGSVSAADKALPILEQNDVQLLFLDVQMPRMNGIDFLKSLETPPMVIMVTAWSEYALQGYELDVLDYLLKPISLERFMKACLKAKKIMELKSISAISPGDTSSYFFIKCNNQYEKIIFNDLLFVEAANNYVTIQTQEKKLNTYLTFKAVLDYLPKEKFIKVHKSFIVALDKIDSIDHEKIRIGEHEIPISRGFRGLVMEQVLSKNLIRR
jgi:DNA-binding LytR/AlgR family response regulator